MARDFLKSSSQYLTAGNVTSPVSGYPFTIAYWCNPRSVTQTWRLAVAKGHYSTNISGFWCGPTSGNSSNPGKIQMSMADTGGNVDTWSSTTLTAGAWSHVVHIVTSSTSDFYINGTLDVSRSHSQAYTADTNNDLFVGAMGAGSTAELHMDGGLSDIAIWDGINLNADQISALAAGISPLLVRPESLSAYWPLEGRTNEPDYIGGATASPGTAPSVIDSVRILRPHSPIVFIPAAAVGGGFQAAWAQGSNVILGAWL